MSSELPQEIVKHIFEYVTKDKDFKSPVADLVNLSYGETYIDVRSKRIVFSEDFKKSRAWILRKYSTELDCWLSSRRGFKHIRKVHLIEEYGELSHQSRVEILNH